MTESEIRVLEMLAGKREWQSGAWVNSCFEFLRKNGYCAWSSEEITDKGKAFLDSRNDT